MAQPAQIFNILIIIRLTQRNINYFDEKFVRNSGNPYKPQALDNKICVVDYLTNVTRFIEQYKPRFETSKTLNL